MQVRGIRSSRLINRATCGGEKKAGLVPRHGFMMSGVNHGTVLGLRKNYLPPLELSLSKV